MSDVEASLIRNRKGRFTSYLMLSLMLGLALLAPSSAFADNKRKKNRTRLLRT